MPQLSVLNANALLLATPCAVGPGLRRVQIPAAGARPGGALVLGGPTVPQTVT